MRKVLIVSFYWPPAGGGGVQRVTKFCKYLPLYGWEPVVLTSRDASVEVRDESLLADVGNVRRVAPVGGWEPHGMFRRFSGGGESVRGGKETRAGWKSGLGEFVRLNFFVPDSRIGWYRPALKKGLELVREEKPDLIFSTSPPYTPHLVARRLARAAGVPHVVDYRDPWVENHAYNTTWRFPWIVAWNRLLEQKVLQGADAVTAANPRLADLASGKLDPDARSKVLSLTNGFDPDDVPGTPAPPPSRFTVSYYGTIYDKGFPENLFTQFARLVSEDRAFARDAVFQVTGSVAPAVREKMEKILPPTNLEFRAYLPHKEMLKELFAPRVLVLVVNHFQGNEATVPGKVYEYLATGNPVLGIGPVPGDAADMLAKGRGARMCATDETEGVRHFYRQAYDTWKDGGLQTHKVDLPQFDRKKLTRKLADVFQSLASPGPD